MSKIILVLLCIAFANFGFAQQDTTGIKKAMETLKEAMLAKDTVTLKTLLSKDIIYGHSNGWMQTRQDIFTDFATGKNGYNKIEHVGNETYIITGDAVTVRSIIQVDGFVNSTNFNMKLQVLQVWQKVKKNWVLIARQSVKI
jgi:Domain of unknown function (DUF4440)